MTRFHTYVAAADPAARDLLERLLEWQTNKSGWPVVESTEELALRHGPERIAGSLTASFAGDVRPTPPAVAPGRPGRASRRNFNAVVAYEDVTAAKKAKEICDRLRCSIDYEVIFEMHLWRFDVLGTPGLLDTAVRDAAQSRLIVFAARGLNVLPAGVKAWIELWVAERRARPGALVLLVEPLAPSISLRMTPQFAYLESIAQRARMDFFASISNPPKTAEQKL